MLPGLFDHKLRPLVLLFYRLWALAWPLIGRELLAFSKTLVVLSYVGHVLPEQLGALVMAQTLYQSTGTTV
jgi:Na+-driven multidrug efflux pump